MDQHRIRLSDADIALVVAALRSRLAMLTGARRLQAVQLIARLEEGGVGNPHWRME